MDSMLASRSRLIMTYNGKDISADISDSLISASWSDKTGKEADEITVELEDTKGRWSGAWLPSKGATITAALRFVNWDKDGQATVIPWGTFQIDEISLAYPSKVTIKGVSTPVTSKIRGQAKTRAWEDIRLSKIAADIASSAGLSLMLEVSSDPLFQREDQMQESDLAFLQGLCTDLGYSLKVSTGKLVIFDQEIYEAKTAALTITPEDLTGYTLKTKSAGIHKSCTVSYHDIESNEELEYTAEWNMENLSGEDLNERELKVNQKVKSRAEAENLAWKSLRDSNKFEVSGSLNSRDFRLIAGINITLSGFGRFDGKYFVDNTTHRKAGDAFSVSAEIRKSMSGKSIGSGNMEVAFQDFSVYGQDFNE